MAETDLDAPETPSAPTPSSATTYDPGAVLKSFTEKLKASEAVPGVPAVAAPKDAPAAKPAAIAEPYPAKPAEAPTKPKTTAKDLAAKFAGKETPKQPGAWDENATKALSRLGLREEEAAELKTFLEQKSWGNGWRDKLQKVQAKQDADFAALKGARESTPGALRPQAQQQADQPGSGQVADLFETITSKLGDEIGGENAKLLRQGFDLLQRQNDELRQELTGYTRSVQVERESAEIEAMVQKSRASLREEFPWIDDDERFEAVATELAGMRPDEVTPDGIKASMRKAARIVFYDEVRADAAAVASKLDTKRKTRASDTSPNGSGAHDDSEPLDDYRVVKEQMRMRDAGIPQEQIVRFVQNNAEKRLRAQRKR